MEKHRIILSQRQIDEFVEQVSAEISSLQGSILLICVEQGGRRLTDSICDHLSGINYDRISVIAKSYDGVFRNKQVRLSIDTDIDFNRYDNIVIIDDIIDSGNTINTILRFLSNASYNCKLDKNTIVISTLVRHTAYIQLLFPISIRHTLCYNQDDFLYGFGLDDNGQCREINYIYSKS